MNPGKRLSGRICILALALLLLAGCVSGQAAETDGMEGTDRMFYAHVNGSVLTIAAEDNSSADAFLDLLKAGDVQMDMHDYGGFEKVGSLGTTLPRNDEPITTEPGDVILYQGSQVTIYYDVNSWNFTRLGRVHGLSPEELKEILGSGNAEVTFSLSSGKEDADELPVLAVSQAAGGVIALQRLAQRLDQLLRIPLQVLPGQGAAGGDLLVFLRLLLRLVETGVGQGLQRAIDEGIVAREDVFITTKIYGGNYERAGGIINDALADLGVDYIDLLLIHQPGADDEGVYKAMEDAVRDGRLRSIGISNYYTPEAVDEVLSFAAILPAVIQNENHLYYQNTELQEYVKPYGIVIESWYPFGGRGHTGEHLGNETVVRIADRHNKTAAQVILRWQLQAGFIAIPGSSNPEHIAENYDIFDFELSDSEMEEIRQLDRHERYENW